MPLKQPTISQVLLKEETVTLKIDKLLNKRATVGDSVFWTPPNVEDCASRGQSMEALIKNYTGISAPDFIQGPSDECPRNPEGCERIMSDDLEIKK